VTVIRPLAVSVAFAVVTPLVCWGVVGRVTGWVDGVRRGRSEGVVVRACRGTWLAVCVQTAVLVGFVAGSSYAGTSNLFAAYLAGACVSWWDSEVPHLEDTPVEPVQESNQQESSTNRVQSGSVESEDDIATSIAPSSTQTPSPPSPSPNPRDTGIAIYHKYYAQPVQRILKPFFFVCSFHFPSPTTFPPTFLIPTPTLISF